MPLLSRYMIRAAFFNLWVGFTLAMLLLVRKAIPNLLPGSIWQWIPAHVDLLLVGWMVQLTLGVAYWILPRLPHTSTERGRFALAITAAISINLGVWLHTGAVLISPWHGGTLPVQTVGLILQTIATLAFAAHAWPRIRPTFTE
jgi:hypothetical protein